MSSIYETVLRKIEEKTVTCSDFNALIAESLPKSAVERVQRRTRRTPRDSHIDQEGHQHLSLPHITGRTVPKRRPDLQKAQMTHRGRAAHRQSTRTQRHHPYGEAINFVQKYRGKPLAEYRTALSQIEDCAALRRLVTAILSSGIADYEAGIRADQRDWFRDLHEQVYDRIQAEEVQ